MRDITKTIDVNETISNIKTEVRVDSKIAKAVISFDNLGYGVVSAVKFCAKGYNSFGDLISVNGKNEFIIVVQDLNIKPYDSLQKLEVVLPNLEIRRLELQERQVCFSDGSITTYLGCDQRNFNIQEYENCTNDEQNKLVALKYKYGEQYKYVPKEFDCGWICSCGCFNKNENQVCAKCKVPKEEILKTIDEKIVSEIINEYIESEKILRESAEIERIEKEKKDKGRKKKITIVFAFVLMFIMLFSFLITMAGRTTYSSEEEMKSNIAGVYTQYKDGKAYHQIKISGDILTYRYVTSGLGSTLDIKEYNPQMGTFEASFAHCVVKSNGDIIFDGKLHEKGGSWNNSSSSYLSSYESANSVLKISNVNVTNNSGYTVCTGTMTNNGSKTYSYVKVKGAFKSSSGTVLDTDWTYAVGSEGLSPGESTTFRMSVSKNSNIKSCSVSIIDYD